MEIYSVTHPFKTTFGNWVVGDRFYKEPYNSVPGTNNYYPLNGSYPLWDRHIPDIENFMSKTAETDRPKEYFIDKIYTQEQWDNAKKITHE